MGIQADAFVLMHPSYMEPEFLLQYNQVSQFIDLLSDGGVRVRLAEDDLLVYMKQMNIRTKMGAGTASWNELPGVDILTSMISTATYELKVRAGWDHHDIQAGSRWGFSVVDAYRKGGQQANYQLCRDASLYGMNPLLGEGIVNAAGALSINLPPDQYGNDTVLTYDNGAMAFFLAQQVQGIKTRTMQMGMGKKITLLGPQRTLGQFEYNVVGLTQFQRVGAGTQSTAGTMKEILMANGDTLVWGYDDTLIGKGSGGSDLVIMDMPQLEKPKDTGIKINTNEFANLTPGSSVCVTQYADMAAPREITSPMAGGATDFVQEWRISSGWPVRPAALTLISMVYQ